MFDRPLSFRASPVAVVCTTLAVPLIYMLSVGPVIYFSVVLTHGSSSSAPTWMNVRHHDWAGNSSFAMNGGRYRERRDPHPYLVNAYRPLWWAAEHTRLGQQLNRYCDWWLGLKKASIFMEPTN
jgi:hypothetical protein